MKKFIFIALVLIMIPINISALSLGTKIVGNEKIKPGSNIIYTVILDHPLTEYSAEISYDRDALNLVSIEEININTTEKKFVVEKSNPILLNINSEMPANIVYTLTFDVKNYTKMSSTELGIKTTKAKYQKEELTSTEAFINPDIVEEDILFQDEEEHKNENKYISNVLTNVKNILNNYGSPITYGSVALNVILLIALIISVIRKKVDYDF